LPAHAIPFCPLCRTDRNGRSRHTRVGKLPFQGRATRGSSRPRCVFCDRVWQGSSCQNLPFARREAASQQRALDAAGLALHALQRRAPVPSRKLRRSVGRGGWATKIHALTDVLGRPYALLLIAGNVNDIKATPALIERRAPCDTCSVTRDTMQTAFARHCARTVPARSEAYYSLCSTALPRPPPH
jgi:hypothetical protein